MEISLAIKNIRRITDMPYLPIKPITILIGRNSAGKSTFLRALPLIRQSVETPSSAPVLWYGKYVDFGDFKTAVQGATGRDECAFKFRVQGLFIDPRKIYRYGTQLPPTRIEDLEVQYVVSASRDATYLKGIKLAIPNEDIDVDIAMRKGSSDYRLLLNSEDVSRFTSNYEQFVNPGSLFAVPAYVSKSKERRAFLSTYDLIFDQLLTYLKGKADKRLKEKTLRVEARRILEGGPISDATLEQLQNSATTTAMTDFYRRARQSADENYKELYRIARFARAMRVLEALEEVLETYFRGTTYMGPARAASERYYRNQELAVSEIAPSGENFPMYLASLLKGERQDFSDFVNSIFGFGVNITSTEGHISIHVTTDTGNVNVTDTGYGVSQILPVLGVLWSIARGSAIRQQRQMFSRGGHRLVAIEQPELHLHPAHQAKLADVFAAIVERGDNDGRRNIRLVIETHSEALINRLGELIEQGRIPSDCVEIAVFSADDDLNSPPIITSAWFNSEGVLKGWPHGFFNYS
ncbi:AAA family ATPase [Paracoccus sp. MC1854]|uniref:AAA family ATPase n=1 Tax=Paracoccus sp. MC1854 TaxID=2760306 RepID=UPI0016040DDB|nr:AAA family ATPase [Paracoccus sp. MC1854]MBB1492968.1 AAA family ATPase [Paracoccus sp. MC1854]